MQSEYNLFDDYGELISSTVRRKPRLRGDWIVFYKKPLRKLAEEAPDLATVKIYLWLASKQTFEDYVMTTRKQISITLGFTRQTVAKAIAWLTAHHYLTEQDVEGNRGYLLNPDITVKGAGKKESVSKRWRMVFGTEEPNSQSEVTVNANGMVQRKSQSRGKSDKDNRQVPRKIDKETGEIIS